MANVKVNIVGSESNPIKVYWDVKNKKSDEYLLLLSICSGAYGHEYLDKDSFIDLCNKFFRYGKNEERYNEQLRYVVSYGEEDCVDYLQSKLHIKWQLFLDFDFKEKIALA